MTLLRLAQDLGVSRATVSNAYNHPDQLSADLRQRILERAAELGFPGPNPLARGLRRHRVGAVGLLLGEPLSYAFADPAAVAISDGLAQAIDVEGFALLLLADSPASAGAGASDDDLPAKKVTEAAVDGWVVYAMEDDHSFVAAARARHEPMVVLDQPAVAGVPRVEVDDAEGTRLAAAHLLGLGHRQLVVLSFPFIRDGRSGPADRARQDAGVFRITRHRLDGVLDAVAAFNAGVAAGGIPASVTVVECDHNDPESGAAAFAALLASGRALPTATHGLGNRRSLGRAAAAPTAVVAMSDQLAFGAIRAARAAGLAVPDDLSVTGFDDVVGAAVADPPLTTIRQPLLERGRVTGALLLDLIHGRPVEPVTACPVELVVRGSTAHPPGLPSSGRSPQPVA
jgi:DNA-binding LacI/PurR family transcriptional regulator